MDALSQTWDHLTAAIINTTVSLWHSASHSMAALGTGGIWELVLYWGLVLVMVAGVVGAFIPAMPGVALILAAVVIWGLIKGFAGLAVALGTALAAFLLSVAVDYLAGILSARKVGASNWAQIGAIVGMILGFLGLLPALPVGGPLVGILFGTVLGAFLGEFLHRRELELPIRLQQSLKVGVAIVVGTLVGNVLQGLLGLVALIVFLWTTLPTLQAGL